MIRNILYVGERHFPDAAGGRSARTSRRSCSRARPRAAGRSRFATRSAPAAAASSRSCSSRRWCWPASRRWSGWSSRNSRCAMGLSLLAGSDALPFWINDSLSWRTVLYTALLTLFGAAIVGILPALRVTKINVQDALRSESAARSGLRFGGFWTTVIVVQVAITVAFLPLAAGGVFESNRFRQRAEGIGAERYLTASVDMDREDHGLDSAAFAGARAPQLRRAGTTAQRGARCRARRICRPASGRGPVQVSDRGRYDDRRSRDRPAQEHARAGFARLLCRLRHVGGRRSRLRAARLRNRPRADREPVVCAPRVRRPQPDRSTHPHRER